MVYGGAIAFILTIIVITCIGKQRKGCRILEINDVIYTFGFSKAVNIIGIILTFIGTSVSLWSIVTASASAIAAKLTWSYEIEDVAFEASTQKYLGKKGILIIGIGCFYQISGIIDWISCIEQLLVTSLISVSIFFVFLLIFRLSVEDDKQEITKE